MSRAVGSAADSSNVAIVRLRGVFQFTCSAQRGSAERKLFTTHPLFTKVSEAEPLETVVNDHRPPTTRVSVDAVDCRRPSRPSHRATRPEAAPATRKFNPFSSLRALTLCGAIRVLDQPAIVVAPEGWVDVCICRSPVAKIMHT